MRMYSACLLIGFILIFASENNASTATEGIDFALDYFHNYNGIQCVALNDTHASEREHLLDLIKIAASGAFPFLATKTALAGLGFTSAGITKGSFAAAWMSRLPIASGGGVAQGSSVAIIQALDAAGLGNLAAPLAIGGTAIGLAYLYRYEIFCDHELWETLKSFEFSRLVDRMQAKEWQEKFEYSMKYMNNKKNELLDHEYVQYVTSAICTSAEKVADVASDLKQKAIEELPQIKEKIDTATQYATDVYQQVSESETVNSIKSQVQQLAEQWGLNNLGLRYN